MSHRLTNDDFARIESFPLTWPTGWPRTTTRSHARFSPKSMIAATREVYAELGRMGVGDFNVIISTNVALRRDGNPLSNQRIPADPGVAAYFKFKGEPHVLACDKWILPEHNLYAIAKHVEALRAQERWGVGTLQQAFTGYKALPAPGDKRSLPWWKVLGFEDDGLTIEDARAQFRELAMKHHPDRGGDPERFKELNDAMAEAKAALA